MSLSRMSYDLGSSKICIDCGGIYYKRKRDTLHKWESRKYCSPGCYHPHQKGRVQTEKARTNIIRAAAENRKKMKPDSAKRGVETRRKNGFPQLRPEVRAKISATLKGHSYTPRGEKNPLWRGTRNLRELLWFSAEYRDWRQQIMKRDDYTCQLCGIRNQAGLGKTVIMNVDHYPKPLREFTDEIVRITPSMTTHERREYALKLGELWDINNGRTLCIDCHRKAPNHGRPKWKIGSERAYA